MPLCATTVPTSHNRSKTLSFHKSFIIKPTWKIIFDDQSTMYPNEPSLLRTCQEASNTPMIGGSFSSLMTHDYGECDVSLRSNHISNPGIDETFGLSQKGAHELLRERLREFALSSGDLNFASDGKCTFVAGGDHAIDVSIRDETKMVVASTVVHKGGHAHKSHRRSGASCSPMTKMMKHNALLSQAATTGRDKPVAYSLITKMIIDFSIRDDTKTVVMSTVVHKGKHAHKTHRRSGASYSPMMKMMKHNALLSQAATGRDKPVAYSLMTKMMKHNALLSQATTGRGHPVAYRVGVYDGNFILFSNMSISVLSSNSQLELILDNFILNATQICTDFANTQRRCPEAAVTSMPGDFFSSVMTDDYDERDVSLRSYHISNPGIDETFGLSQKGAHELLRERLCAFAISSGDLQVASDGKCTFVAGGNHTIDLSIRDDTKAVVMSTVVHKGKYAHKTHRRSGALYSRMTKVMKHNALLSQAATGRDKPVAYRIGVNDGTFILFSNTSISMLSSNWKLSLVLDDFVLKAVQIGRDLGITQRGCQEATKNKSLLGDFFSSIMSDNYGERDVSMRVNHISNPGIDETFGLSQQGANELLRKRLRAFVLSPVALHVASGEKCTFVAGGDHTIDVSIRDDTKNVNISTVVHKGKHAHKNHRHSRSSYYLMTKMMKHNALLSQATTGRGDPVACRVGLYDGSFILFSTMSISVLSSNSLLELILDDFILNAAQIGRDFANAQRFRRKGSRKPLVNTRGAKAA